MTWTGMHYRQFHPEWYAFGGGSGADWELGHGGGFETCHESREGSSMGFQKRNWYQMHLAWHRQSNG